MAELGAELQGELGAGRHHRADVEQILVGAFRAGDVIFVAGDRPHRAAAGARGGRAQGQGGLRRLRPGLWAAVLGDTDGSSLFLNPLSLIHIVGVVEFKRHSKSPVVCL